MDRTDGLSEETSMKLLTEMGYLNQGESLEDRQVRVNQYVTEVSEPGVQNFRTNGVEMSFDNTLSKERRYLRVASPSLPGITAEIRRNFVEDGDTFTLDLSQMPLKPLLAKAA